MTHTHPTLPPTVESAGCTNDCGALYTKARGWYMPGSFQEQATKELNRLHDWGDDGTDRCNAIKANNADDSVVVMENCTCDVKLALVALTALHNQEMEAVLEGIRKADNIEDSDVKRLYDLSVAIDAALTRIRSEEVS